MYFEKQVGGKCAIHALNNLFQAPIVGDHQYNPAHKYNIADIDQSCQQKEDMLLGVADGKVMAVRNGSYSLESICFILKEEGYRTQHISCDSGASLAAILSHGLGFVLFCSPRQNYTHYTSARYVSGAWYFFDSLAAGPKQLSQPPTNVTYFLHISREESTQEARPLE